MSLLRIRYQTIVIGDIDIHVRTLRDRQQYSDTHSVASKLGISSAAWPIFGVIWPSGEILAHLMFDHEIEGKRVLEVGCGIALASLVLSYRLADITATDYHPDVEYFLSENVKLNKGKKIPFVRTGWGDEDSGLGEFDLVIGSDVLYERSHVELLAGFIDQHARKHCDVILVDPGRGHHACFSKKMVGLGYSHSQSKPLNVEYLIHQFQGRVLRYHR
jgi:predicted nicotinamide N-methyase